MSDTSEHLTCHCPAMGTAVWVSGAVFLCTVTVLTGYYAAPWLGFVRPETGHDSSSFYVLKRNVHYKQYNSLTECFLSSAMKKVPNAREWLDNMTGLEAFQRALKNSHYNLKDEKSPLTYDEVLSIYIYTCSTPLRVDRMLTEQLATGDAGDWNCFLDYLFSAMDKIKGTEAQDKEVYRGVSPPEYDEKVWNTKFRQGDIVSMDAFTSSTVEQRVAAEYSVSHVIVNLKKIGQRPKYVTPYAHLTTEAEFLWPPGSRLKVVREPYYMDCTLTDTTFYCDVDGNGTARYRFVDLEDVTDSLGFTPFEWYDNWKAWLVFPFVVGGVCGGIVAFVLIRRRRGQSETTQFQQVSRDELA